MRRKGVLLTKGTPLLFLAAERLPPDDELLKS
jgi:hypothetical protein